MKTLDAIALTLLIVGGLNWLLVGLFEFDLVAMIAGGSTTIFAKDHLYHRRYLCDLLLEIFPYDY